MMTSINSIRLWLTRNQSTLYVIGSVFGVTGLKRYFLCSRVDDLIAKIDGHIAKIDGHTAENQAQRYAFEARVADILGISNDERARIQERWQQRP